MSDSQADMGGNTGIGRAPGYTRHSTGTGSFGVSGWTGFAAIMMVLVGTFNVIYGLVALFQDRYYLVGPQGLLLLDLTWWGWVHLVVGALAVVTGVALAGGVRWAKGVAVALASINAVTQLAFMPAYPAWSLVAIAVDVLVIWAVIVHGGRTGEETWD